MSGKINSLNIKGNIVFFPKLLEIKNNMGWQNTFLLSPPPRRDGSINRPPGNGLIPEYVRHPTSSGNVGLIPEGRFNEPPLPVNIPQKFIHIQHPQHIPPVGTVR